MTKLSTVRFIKDAKIPALGEKSGLSNLRVAGGNEAPVDHEMTLEDGWVVIKHKSGNFPTTRIPMSNIAYVEDQEELGAAQGQQDPYKPKGKGEAFDRNRPHDPSAPHAPYDRTVPLDPKTGKPLEGNNPGDPNSPFDRTVPEDMSAPHDPLDPPDPNKPYDASRPYDPNAPGNKNKPHNKDGSSALTTKDDTSGSDTRGAETRDPLKPDDQSRRAAGVDEHGFKSDSAKRGDAQKKAGGDEGPLDPGEIGKRGAAQTGKILTGDDHKSHK